MKDYSWLPSGIAVSKDISVKVEAKKFRLTRPSMYNTPSLVWHRAAAKQTRTVAANLTYSIMRLRLIQIIFCSDWSCYIYFSLLLNSSPTNIIMSGGETTRKYVW